MKTKIQKINIQKAALLTVATLGLISPALAQNVSISPTGNAPDNSAALDIRDYTDKGVLIPRIALTSNTDVTTIPAPALSLLVYNTGTGGLTPAGYYYWNGSRWVRLVTMGGSPSDAWLTLGNVGTNPATHFVGTADNVDLVFRTNNTEKMRITAGGNVGIGTTGPEGSLDVAKGAGEAQADATSGYLPYGTEKADLILERLISPTKSLNGYPASLIDLRARNISGDIWSVAQILGVVDLNVSGGYAGGLAFLTSAGGIVNPAGRRTKGSAPVTRMVIDANGNVGIGTTSPAEKVEINGRLLLNYAATPIIRLRTNVNFGGSTKGITEHRILGPYNDPAGILGALYIAAGKSSNDTKNEIILFNDGCNGPGGTHDCNVRMIKLLGDTIYASGNVGIGTTTPAQKLEVCGNAKVVGQIIANSSNLSAGVTCSSDIRYKKDITPLTNALSNVMQLRGVNYFWKTKEFPEKQFPDTKQIGFIAQELEKVYPEVVFTDKDGYKSVDYSRLTPILVEAIKEQQKIIQQLQEENAQTKSEVKALAEKMNILINTLSAEKKVGNK